MVSSEDRAAAIHREALRLWWEREATLPRFVRRAPDAIDVATGAWGAMVLQAEQEIAACPAPTTIRAPKTWSASSASTD